MCFGVTLLSNVIYTGFAVLLVIVKECVESDDLDTVIDDDGFILPDSST